MTIRFYLVPSDVKADGGIKPKYFDDVVAVSMWQAMYYGFMPACIVRADVTAQQHTDLTANADVLAAPANIDNNLTSGAVTTVQNALETLKIPSGWVDTSFTYRQVLRIVAKVFQVSQRFEGRGWGKLLPDGLTLDDTWADLPQAWQNGLLDVAASFNWDTTGLSGTTKLRAIYKFMADQFSAPIQLEDSSGVGSL